MTEVPRTPVTRDWRSALAIGLAIGIGLGVARGVQANLESSLGYFGAVAVAALSAGVVGALVSIVAFWLTKPRDTKKD